MPVFKQKADLVIRGLRAFLNLEAGITRVGDTRSGQAPVTGRQAGPAAGNGTDGRAGVRPENIVWIFGSGRSGSTWLSAMMGNMSGQTLWGEPWVGALFGKYYYAQDDQRRRNPEFILGRHRDSWLRSIRNFVLDAAVATFPNLTANGYLVIKEPNGSVGAPLLMEALPESRMILLVRDPRDIVASVLDARREGGWNFERNKDSARRQGKEPPTKDSVIWAERAAEATFLHNLGRAKQAYDAHRGRKVLVKYEDLRVDTLEQMRRIYSALGMPVDDEELKRSVEKHSWENIPEEKKGEGKFYRKATPGGWKEDLTPEQAKAIERVTEPLLRELYPEKV